MALARPALRRFDPAMTFPEVLNEPVFAGDPACLGPAAASGRAGNPRRAACECNRAHRGRLGRCRGPAALQPKPDPNVVYSFHLYEPAELTALAAYRSGLDAGSHGSSAVPCHGCRCVRGHRQRRAAIQPTAGLMRFYCAQHWDVTRLAGAGREAGAWARRITLLCWRANSVPPAVERGGSPGMARRRARGMRAQGDRLGAVGL